MQVASNTFLNLIHTALYLASREVLSRVLTALNLLPSIATLASAKKIELATQANKLSTDLADCQAVVFAEVGNRFVIRHQTSA